MPASPKVTPSNSPAIRRQADLFILLVTLALVFIMAARTPFDTDMWWHLAAGRQVVTSGHLSTPDAFSFTRPGVPWIDHSWLPDVGMYLLFTSGGFFALGLVVALAAVASLAILWFHLEGPALWRAFLIILTGVVASANWTARPQVLTLVLTTLAGLLLERYRQAKAPLWPLPILALVWANVHAGFLVLFMLVGLILVGDSLGHLFRPRDASLLPWRSIRNLALWGLVSALAVNINPNGFLLWLAPLRQNVGVGLAIPLISEWASPDFHNPFFIPFLIMLFGMFAAIALSPRRLTFTAWLTFAWFTLLALVSQRNLGVFAMVAAPILSRQVLAAIRSNRDHPLLIKIRRWFQPPPPSATQPFHPPKARRWLNLAVFAILALAGISKLVYATWPPLVNAYNSRYFPVAAVTWLKQNGPPGNMFNSFNWGGYLDWNLPAYPVFIDGRVDPFGNQILSDWVGVVTAQPGWQGTLDRWQVRLVLLEPDRPIAQMLPAAGWKLLYQDQSSVLFGN